MSPFRALLALLLSIPLLLPAAGSSTTALPSAADPLLLETVYPNEETLTYRVSWLGFDAGELVMRIKRRGPLADDFDILVTARASKFLSVFYPVDDRFEIMVTGSRRLPLHYVSFQKKGRTDLSRKITLYDQKSLKVTYAKNQEEPLILDIPFPVHNELSAFLFLRALPMQPGESLMIPTFADRKAHPVRVLVEKRETLETVLGPVPTIRVEPQITFKGLYEKTGNATIWLTDDKRRIPVLVKAKVLIGSLKAELAAYSRPGSREEGSSRSEAAESASRSRTS